MDLDVTASYGRRRIGIVVGFSDLAIIDEGIPAALVPDPDPEQVHVCGWGQGLIDRTQLEAKAAKLHADYDVVFQTTQEDPNTSRLGAEASNMVKYILQTVEKMKDKDFTDPPGVETPPYQIPDPPTEP